MSENNRKYREVKNMHKKIIRILFIIRISLWIIATVATFYWIVWSFKLYNMGIYDVHEYGTYFRPIFGRGFLIAVVSICLSFILRSISDKLKEK